MGRCCFDKGASGSGNLGSSDEELEVVEVENPKSLVVPGRQEGTLDGGEYQDSRDE